MQIKCIRSQTSDALPGLDHLGEGLQLRLRVQAGELQELKNSHAGAEAQDLGSEDKLDRDFNTI